MRVDIIPMVTAIRRSPSIPAPLTSWIGVHSHGSIVEAIVVTASDDVSILHVGAHGSSVAVLGAGSFEYRAADVALGLTLLASPTDSHVHLVLLVFMFHALIK